VRVSLKNRDERAMVMGDGCLRFPVFVILLYFLN
jgi:hypothetical protein